MKNAAFVVHYEFLQLLVAICTAAVAVTSRRLGDAVDDGNPAWPLYRNLRNTGSTVGIQGVMQDTQTCLYIYIHIHMYIVYIYIYFLHIYLNISLSLSLTVEVLQSNPDVEQPPMNIDPRSQVDTPTPALHLPLAQTCRSPETGHQDCEHRKGSAHQVHWRSCALLVFVGISTNLGVFQSQRPQRRNRHLDVGWRFSGLGFNFGAQQSNRFNFP